MDFSIRLLTYDNQRWEFQRSKFIQLWPECMISLALQDLEATTIDIEQLSVTPYVMNYLTEIYNNNKLPIPDVDMTSASLYLLIPILEAVSNPFYEGLLQLYPRTNLMKQSTFIANYEFIMAFALRYSYTSLRDYLMSLNITGDQPILHYIGAYYDYPKLLSSKPTITSSTVYLKLYIPELESSKDALTPLEVAILGNNRNGIKLLLDDDMNHTYIISHVLLHKKYDIIDLIRISCKHHWTHIVNTSLKTKDYLGLAHFISDGKELNSPQTILERLFNYPTNIPMFFVFDIVIPNCSVEQIQSFLLNIISNQRFKLTNFNRIMDLIKS